MKNRVSEEFLRDFQKALADNPDLPVVFIKDGFNRSKCLDTAYMMPKYVEIGKVLDTTGFEKRGIPYMEGEKLRRFIRDELNFEYGLRFYDDNPDEYMRIFTEKAKAYRKWVKAVIVHVDVI